MATRGAKPKPTVLKLVQGNPGHRPLPENEVEADGKPVKPKKCTGRPGQLWDEVVSRAPWLAAADSYKLHMFCALHAEFERSPAKMIASRLSQLRALGSELGLDPSARTRVGGSGAGKPKDPAEGHFS